MSVKKSEEYKKRIVYQIYPASFCDANNDGWGDLQGIISKLDYLKDLGVGIIWMSPIYKSPMVDMGYDISDYKDINPLFGTMNDFDQLMEECNKRDIKIVMDLVVNHTSSEHKWFKEAVSNPTTKYRNYYYIRKGKGKNYTLPPNNWTSVFAGSAWEPVPGDPTNFYLHLYTTGQPDLNYHSENVILEVEDILKFWLDKGVYGFRCDVINSLWKSSLENGVWRINQRGKEFYEDQEGNHVILSRLRKEVLDNYDCFLVGEDASATVDIANSYIDNQELEMLISFEHQNVDKLVGIPIFKKKFKPSNFLNVLFRYQEGCKCNCLYFENHDQQRTISRFIDPNYEKLGAKSLGMLLLTLRGTPFIYQGEEIGMKNLPGFPENLEDTKDVVVSNVYHLLKDKLHLSKDLSLKWTRYVSRDDERTPMQWDSHVNAGFNKGFKPWMKVNENYLEEHINVEEELQDKESVLNFYKKLANYRNKSKVLIEGSFKKIKSNKNVATYVREYKNQKLLIIVNLSNKKVRNHIKFDGKLVISNYKEFNKKVLQPYYCGMFIIA